MYAHKNIHFALSYHTKRLTKRTIPHFIDIFLEGKGMKKTPNVVSLHIKIAKKTNIRNTYSIR